MRTGGPGLASAAVRWRTGINTGEVVAGDAGAGQRFVSGDAVNVAARLQQAARPDEILVGQGTYELTLDSAEFEDVDPFAAKGKTEPLSAHRLMGLREDDSPGSAVAHRRLDQPMVGRAAERRVLVEAFNEGVELQTVTVVTVLGAAGVGKSRMVLELLSEIGDRALVLRGRCLSYGEGITYWPIAEAVRSAAGLTEDDSDDALRQKLGALVPEAERPLVVERIGAMLGRFPSAGVAEEISWAVRVLIESLARQKPLVLIIDDIHWAEPTLLDLIEYLADWAHDAPCLILCAARQELLESRPGWGTANPHMKNVNLQPLDSSQTSELIANLVGSAGLPPDVAEKISGAAQGNPLFVEEMVRTVLDSDEGTATIPASIQAVLAARLDSLPAAERAVLERGSIEGQSFHRGAVATLLPPQDRAEVSAHLRALLRKDLLQPARSDFVGDDAYEFRHILIRDAAYASIPKRMRSDLHFQFGEWLTQQAGTRAAEYEELLGYHNEQAYRYRIELGVVDEQTMQIGRIGAGFLLRSGQRALDRGDAVAGLKLLTTAADLANTGDTQGVAIQAELGRALTMSGKLSEAEETLRRAAESALEIGDFVGQAYAETLRLEPLSNLALHTNAEAIEQAEKYLAVLKSAGHQRGVDRAVLELAKHQFFNGHAGLAMRILQDHVKQNPSPSAFDALGEWLPGFITWGPMPVDEATRVIESMAEHPTGRAGEAMALNTLGVMRAFGGRFPEGRELIRRGTAIRAEVGQPIIGASEEGNGLGMLELLAGNYEESARVAKRAVDRLNELGERGFASTVLALEAYAEARAGDIDQAEVSAMTARGMVPDDDFATHSAALRAMALVKSKRGQHEAAVDAVRDALARLELTDNIDQTGDAYMDYARVLVGAGKRDEAIEKAHLAIKEYEKKDAAHHISLSRAFLADLGAVDA